MIELFVMKRIWIIKLRKGLTKFMRVSREGLALFLVVFVRGKLESLKILSIVVQKFFTIISSKTS